MTLVSLSTHTPVFETPHVLVASINVETRNAKVFLTPDQMAFDWVDVVLEAQMVTAEEALIFPSITLTFDYEGDVGHHSFPLIHHFGVDSLDAFRQPGDRLVSMTITYDFARGDAVIVGDPKAAQAVEINQARLEVLVLNDGHGEVRYATFMSEPVSKVVIDLEKFTVKVTQ